MTNGSSMKVESIAECSFWSILQYFQPALSDNLSRKPIFGLFENGHMGELMKSGYLGHMCKSLVYMPMLIISSRLEVWLPSSTSILMYVSCEGSGEWHMCMLGNAIRNQILALVFFTNIQMNTVITFMIPNGDLITCGERKCHFG